MQSPSNSSSLDRWELVIEDEVIDLPRVPSLHRIPAALATQIVNFLPLTLSETRWRRLVLRLQVRRHGAYLMHLAKGWRKAR